MKAYVKKLEENKKVSIKLGKKFINDEHDNLRSLRSRNSNKQNRLQFLSVDKFSFRLLSSNWIDL